MLRMTPLGRSLYAIGLNQEAAFHAGIRVKRIKLWLFVLSGFVCAAVGILYTFELSSAAENIGIGFELQVITIVLLGGVSIFGGSGTILGVALAAFVYAGLRSALLLTSSFNENDFQIVSGGLLILSVLDPEHRRRSSLAGARLAARAAPRPTGGLARALATNEDGRAMAERAVRGRRPRRRRAVGSRSGASTASRSSSRSLHRFANRAAVAPGRAALEPARGCSSDTLDGLARAAAAGRLDGVGVDSWGCRLRAARRRAPDARVAVSLSRRRASDDADLARAHVRRVGRARALSPHRDPDDADQHRLPARR